MISDRQIGEACARHGAVKVAEAAYKRLQGDREALAVVGLPDASNLAEAQHVAAVAYLCMDPEEQAGDTAAAVIDLVRLPR